MPLNFRRVLLVGFFFIALPLLFTSCRKSNSIETDTIFLGHKGSGSNNYSDTFIENTVPSVKNILNKLDGAELDIQMSLDGTPWIWHNANLSGYICDGDSQAIIPEMRDIDIEKIRICHGNKTDRIYKLSEVLDWSNAGTGIYLSLDIKISFSTNTFSLYGGRDGYLTQLATSLASIFKNYRYSDRTLVEIDNQLFCTTLKSFPSTKNITTCFMRYEPMEDKIENAVRLGYDGISCNYTDPTVTAETVAAAHKAGLKVQLWTPYYRDELRTVFAMNPDFIQTDNIHAKQALKVN
ncbi:glycerophosphodiester phosphodiesterase [Pedobacter xixiisoli]|uniref:Glycerophosphoryl diester phosphodiesterase n=1 Tax=Pedobacter xixiisoli TaxID=1476464 RepID=A0A286A009_9SPHI|nr:glycerophosphodiester phosphodiesterase [Pedobacter xixiisoli]SOD15249.1 Glycerophosphoryl diester phosphodiesterase [Pedobacter xixiisoli]